MEQIHKQKTKQRREQPEIEELPDLEPNEVSLEAARFLVRLAIEAS